MFDTTVTRMKNSFIPFKKAEKIDILIGKKKHFCVMFSIDYRKIIVENESQFL